MNDFDYDIVQKKRVARGAFAHVNRKRGKCRLPSDYLTAAQKKEMNGAVKTYNITRPMPLAEFKGMPDDLQREYLRNMQSCGGAATYLADEMGCCSATIREYGEKLGVPFVRGGRNLDLWQKKLSEWHTAEVTAAETPEKQIVEEWSAAHPRKTRQSALLEQYPYAKCVDGISVLCPGWVDTCFSCPIDGNNNVDCNTCRHEFWMQEVE